MTTEKKVRTSRQPESIIKGALKLPLADRVKLKDDLIESIKTEVATLTEAAKQAATIANGTT